MQGEENVYMLCNELIRTGVADPAGTDLYVVFISNEEKKVPLWHQKAGHSDDGFICWDYHVICIQSFASDRSHMKDPEGNWIQLPPKYEPIVAEDGTTNNLSEYIMMSVEDVADRESMANGVYCNKHGVVLNETIFPEFFAQLPAPHT